MTIQQEKVQIFSTLKGSTLVTPTQTRLQEKKVKGPDVKCQKETIPVLFVMFAE